MSCSKIEILPNEPEIVQLKKELFNARYDASFYKCHFENGIVIRERMQYKHDAALLILKKKHKEDVAGLA